MLTFFATSGCIKDQDGLRLAQGLHQRGAPRISDRLVLPPGTSQHMLPAIREGIGDACGHLPAIFALDGA